MFSGIIGVIDKRYFSCNLTNFNIIKSSDLADQYIGLSRTLIWKDDLIVFLLLTHNMT